MNELPKDPDVLLAPADFQKILGCGDDTFREMLEAGDLPEPTLFVKSRPRWRAGLIRAWIRSGGLPGKRPKKPEKAGKNPKTSDEAE